MFSKQLVQTRLKAYRHRHHHNHNSNRLKVDQQTSYANVCTGTPSAGSEDEPSGLEGEETEETASAATVCLNSGNNTADIQG